MGNITPKTQNGGTLLRHRCTEECVRSLITDAGAGTDVDSWGSEIFHCRYHHRKRPSEELKFTQFSRSAYGPRKIYQKNVRYQWIVLNVNIIHLAASVSYCSLACSSCGSPVWKGVSGGAATQWWVWKGFNMSCTSPCLPLPPSHTAGPTHWRLLCLPHTSATDTAVTVTSSAARPAVPLGGTPAGRGVGGRGCVPRSHHCCLQPQGLSRLALSCWGGRQHPVVSPAGDGGRKAGLYCYFYLLEEAQVHGSDGIVQSLNVLACNEGEGSFCIYPGDLSKSHKAECRLDAAFSINCSPLSLKDLACSHYCWTANLFCWMFHQFNKLLLLWPGLWNSNAVLCSEYD